MPEETKPDTSYLEGLVTAFANNLSKEIGGIRLELRDLHESLGVLTGKVDSLFQTVTAVAQARASVPQTVVVPANGTNGSSDANGLSREEKGFWLAFGNLWKRLPAPARWATMVAFLLGFGMMLPTLVRLVPGSPISFTKTLTKDAFPDKIPNNALPPLPRRTSP